MGCHCEGRSDEAISGRIGGSLQSTVRGLAMIIDTHAHVVPKSLLDALGSEKRLFPSVRLNSEGVAPRMTFAGGVPGRPIQPRLHDLAQRRDWLKEARVDQHLGGGWTDVYGYELWGEEGADGARFY